MRALKVLTAVVASLLLVLVMIAAGLWWWSGTQASLDWVLRRVAQSQSIAAQGVTGSLRTGLKAQHIEWHKDQLKVEAFDAELAWQPFAIVRGTVKLDRVHAARIRIEDARPAQPKEVPTHLTLPMRVEASDLRVGQLEWITPQQQVDVRDIAGDYSFNTVSHHVKLARLTWMQGSFSGEGALAATGSLDVDARVQGRFAVPVPESAATAPLTFTATLGGKLIDIDARATLQGTPGSPTAGTTATATAHITPWADQPLPRAQAQFAQLDVGALWAQAPRTKLGGKLQIEPEGKRGWRFSVDANNAAPGAWDLHLLPVEQLLAAGEWQMDGVASIREFRARAGGGTVQASGQWRSTGAWTVDGKVAGVDPGALYSALAHLPVGGSAQVSGEGKKIAFAVDLQSSGASRDRSVAALGIHSARAKGQWDGETLSLPSLDLRLADATVQASLQVQPRAKTGSGRASVDAPGLQARVEGKLAQRSGGGTLQARSSDIAQSLRWLARWPHMPANIAAQLASGRAEVQASWQGGWDDPTVQARLLASQVVLRGNPGWTVRAGAATFNGRLADAQLQLSARGDQGPRHVALDLTGRGGRSANGAWQGQLATVTGSIDDPAIGKGPWSIALQRALDLRWAAGRFEASAGAAALKSPRAGDGAAQIQWDPVRWGGGELQTAGRINGLPLAWLEFFGGAQLASSAISGDMVFDAQWDARLGATPRIRASLVRSRGDVMLLAENAEGRSVRVPAGVREARVAIESNGDALSATLRWDSEHGGTADGNVSTRLTPGGAAGWQWPDSAPLQGQLRAHLPRIGVWSLLAPPGWRLRGSLAANVAVSGTKGDPQLAGTLAADDLALRSVVDGIEMQGGRLRARLEGQRVVIDEFTLHGSGVNGGTLTATGEGAMTRSGPQASVTAQLERLRASIRSDRLVTVSGKVFARRDASGTVVNGKLVVDQALIVLPEQGTPKLGDDVVVRNAPAPVTRREARAADEAAKPASAKLQIAIDIDLGDDFRVQGAGVDTRLRGVVAVSAESVAQPRLAGTIRTAGGEYRAYGQRLEIERGIIRFTGAADNPSLDLLAIRPNITQRVGVQVSGTALLPFVRLYSEPDLPDAEKLAWLVTGRPAPATGAESALVQQAALALLASRSGTGKQGIAATLGLDELSFRRDGSEGPAVTLGKRFSRNFYAAYERSLSGTMGTLFIFYDVTQRLTVRGQAGERTALDLIYTFAFD